MLIKVFGLLAVLFGALAALIATRPADFRLVRTATVNAPPEKVFALVNDFNRWDTWSPWAKLDPAMKKSVGSIVAGTGATYEWSGNSDVGRGKMTILESQPPARVLIRLEFLEPMTATNLTELVLKPEGSGTRVEWIMTGTNNFMAKAFDFFMNMDKTVGADFEKGLKQMKAVAEQ
ncbi:MAG: SRPBCC family protein [Bryobacteraceae bacterium]|nr:SRPBCC family protein [Bryobacteraceae bacterium]